jgi:hypothetical protein
MNKYFKIIGILAVLGIIAALLIYKFIYNKPHRDYEKAKADYTLEASALHAAYVNDKSKADATYTGKVIQISGLMNKTEESDSSLIAIFVFNQGLFGDEGIRCTMLPKFFDLLKNKGSNISVTLKGYCSGYNDTDVIMEKCSVVK